jgi:hypothetical protein
MQACSLSKFPARLFNGWCIVDLLNDKTCLSRCFIQFLQQSRNGL